MIGHTQPRRIAARTVAERIAEELGTTLGDVVGYQVRFTDRVGDRHAGQGDDRRHPARRDPARPDAARATTRSSSTRPTSAASTSTSSSATSSSCCRAGRTSRWSSPRRPSTPSGSPGTSTDAPGHRGLAAAPTRSRCATGRVVGPRRPGRRRRTATRSRRSATPSTSCGRGRRATSSSSSPASGRSATPPRRCARRSTCATPRSCRSTRGCPPPSSTGSSQPHAGRRVVLATNVAETSLTVPGIRYVVDPGTARISRYSRRLKVQRLPIEPVCRRRRNQRAGRCGRVADGICIRLYAEEDFDVAAGVHRAGDPAHQPRRRSSCR